MYRHVRRNLGLRLVLGALVMCILVVSAGRVFAAKDDAPALTGVGAVVTGTKVASGDNPGTAFSYTVTLTNNGTVAQADNPGDEFTDVLPSAVTLVSASATSGTAVATVPTNTVTWNGSLALSGGSVTITINATIPACAPPQVISNQGTILYDADGNGSNEESGVTDDPGVAGAGDPTNFTVNDPGTLCLLSSTFLGGAGDQRGTGISIDGGAIYVSGVTAANGGDGLVARYALPLVPDASPAWSKTWPTLIGNDDFNGIGASSEGVYVAGQSFNRTTDPVGGKEGKGITVKFPLTGPPGGGFDGSTWDVQSPAPPAAFPYGGGEGSTAATVAIEGGLPFVYVTGNSQSSGSNGGRFYVSKVSSAGAVLWTQTDAVAIPFSQGLAITTLNGNVYVAGRNDDAGTQVYLRKYAPAGGPAIWTRKSVTFNGVYQGIAAFGGAIYAFGYRQNGIGSSNDFLIEKWDESGTLQWSQQYDRGALDDSLYGGVGHGLTVYAVGSTTAASAGAKDIVVLELDPTTGSLRSTILYGGAQDDIAKGAATDGSSIFVVGESKSFASVAGNQVGQNDLVLLNFSAAPGDLIFADGFEP